MEVRKVGGYIGAEIMGVDLTTCNEETFQKIKTALWEHGFIYFRDQELTTDEYRQFGQRWGELFVNESPAIEKVPGYAEVEEIRKNPHELSNIGDEWHTDQAHQKNPCMSTILYAKVIPPYGGDTCFASTSAAYDFLSEEMRQKLQGLEAVHSQRFLLEQVAARTGDPDGRFAAGIKKSKGSESIHPVIIAHPENGKACIYVNPSYTTNFVGMTREESKPILDEIYKLILRPEFNARMQWQTNSLALWDNRQVWHYASNDYQGHLRILHRLVVKDSLQ